MVVLRPVRVCVVLAILKPARKNGVSFAEKKISSDGFLAVGVVSDVVAVVVVADVAAGVGVVVVERVPGQLTSDRTQASPKIIFGIRRRRLPSVVHRHQVRTFRSVFGKI